MELLNARSAEILSQPVIAPAATIRLSDLARHVDAVVTRVSVPALAEDRELVLRLIEIGFVPGERVRVVAHGLPGNEPIAVRLGGTTFALRRFEAEYVHVALESVGPA